MSFFVFFFHQRNNIFHETMQPKIFPELSHLYLSCFFLQNAVKAPMPDGDRYFDHRISENFQQKLFTFLFQTESCIPARWPISVEWTPLSTGSLYKRNNMILWVSTVSFSSPLLFSFLIQFRMSPSNRLYLLGRVFLLFTLNFLLLCDIIFEIRYILKNTITSSKV